MKRFFLLSLSMLLFSSACASAGPFGRRGVANTQHAAPARPFLATATDAALYMASIGRMGHFGNPSGGYEGVGVGMSATQAIQNCCYYGRRQIRDQGVAQGANGRWYACCRYW